jgi:hypothetical protein
MAYRKAQQGRITKQTVDSPVLTTPALGTPSAGVMTNMTGAVEASLVDNAVTLAKMAGGTDGNIISYDASGNPVAIATGSDGQALTSAGAGAQPAFEAVSATISASSDYEEGTWTPVFKTNFTTSWGTTVTWTTGGDQEYKYVKVGNMVTCNFDLAGKIMGTDPSGPECLIGGYPFTNTGGTAAGTVLFNHTNLGLKFTTNNQSGCVPFVDDNTTSGEPKSFGGTGYSFPSASVAANKTTYAYFQLTYFTF